jgi:hypothetical protein
VSDAQEIPAAVAGALAALSRELGAEFWWRPDETSGEPLRVVRGELLGGVRWTCSALVRVSSLRAHGRGASLALATDDALRGLARDSARDADAARVTAKRARSEDRKAMEAERASGLDAMAAKLTAEADRIAALWRPTAPAND